VLPALSKTFSRGHKLGWSRQAPADRKSGFQLMFVIEQAGKA